MEDNKARKPAKPKLPKRLSERYLRNAALYYLQRHPASMAHFTEVMDRKIKRSLRAHPDQDTGPFTVFIRETLVPEFEKAGFLNDALYGRALAESLSRKGLPKRSIVMRLKTKGILDAPLPDGHDDFTAALRFCRRKKLGAFARADKTNEPEKELAAMGRAGFSYDIAKKALAMDIQEAEEILST